MKNIILISCVIVAIVGSVFWGVRSASKRNLSGQWTIFAESELIHGSKISRVMFFDRENGIIVSPGFIARSKDGGKRWTPVHASADTGYYGFAFSNAQNGIAVGSVNNDVPVALRTSDAGQSWHPLSIDLNLLNKNGVRMTTFLDVCFDSTGKTWIVGNKGIVSATDDENKLNITSVHPTTAVLYSVACGGNGQIWAVGEGTVFSSSNDWQEKQFGTNYYFGKVKTIGNDIWLLGRDKRETNPERDYGVVWKSGNAGGTWDNKTSESVGPIYDIAGVEGMLWSVGVDGQIYHSQDNGESWTSFQSPTKADLLSVYFLDNKTGWITGDRGTVLGFRK